MMGRYFFSDLTLMAAPDQSGELLGADFKNKAC